MNEQERKFERRRNIPESLAIRFPAEYDAKGGDELFHLRIPQYVVLIDEQLIYIISSTHWGTVTTAFNEAGVPFEFKRGLGLTKKALEDKETWNEYKQNT